MNVDILPYNYNGSCPVEHLKVMIFSSLKRNSNIKDYNFVVLDSQNKLIYFRSNCDPCPDHEKSHIPRSIGEMIALQFDIGGNIHDFHSRVDNTVFHEKSIKFNQIDVGIRIHKEVATCDLKYYVKVNFTEEAINVQEYGSDSDAYEESSSSSDD